MKQEELDEYFKMAFSVTLVLYAFEDGELKVFLKKIEDQPFKNAWSLPGRLVQAEEALEDASLNILKDTLGTKSVEVEQLNAYGKLHRHPLGRVIDISFFGLVHLKKDKIKVLEKADWKWIETSKIPELAYDHEEIIDFARQRLKRRAVSRPIGFKLLDDKFTLTQMQQLYESILRRKLDKRNFRKKIEKMDVLKKLDQKISQGPGRKASLYKFDKKKYQNREKNQGKFEF